MDKIKQQTIKQCVKCGNILPATPEYFGKTKQSSDGLKGTCKACIAEYNKKYNEKHKEKLYADAKIYRKNNKEKINETKKKYQDKNWEKISRAAKEYKHINKERLKIKQREYYRDRLKKDETLRERLRLQKVLHRALFNGTNTEKTRNLMGCTAVELRKHFESLFSEGMTWENHGVHGWHIDHMIPCSKFNILDDDEKRKCFHYTNLQPLWAEENMAKRDSLDWDES